MPLSVSRRSGPLFRIDEVISDAYLRVRVRMGAALRGSGRCTAGGESLVRGTDEGECRVQSTLEENPPHRLEKGTNMSLKERPPRSSEPHKRQSKAHR
jgi:hypothetical protein